MSIGRSFAHELHAASNPVGNRERHSIVIRNGKAQIDMLSLERYVKKSAQQACRSAEKVHPVLFECGS